MPVRSAYGVCVECWEVAHCWGVVLYMATLLLTIVFDLSFFSLSDVHVFVSAVCYVRLFLLFVSLHEQLAVILLRES